MTESRCLGYVIFRVIRDENGSCIVQVGEVTTTRREYLTADGSWSWDPNRAWRIGLDDSAEAEEARRAAIRESKEACYRALLYPSRKSEDEAIAARMAGKRSDAAYRAAETRRDRF